MTRIWVWATAALLSAAMAAPALAADTPTQVVERHARLAKLGDVAGVLADYADNAVVVTPVGMGSPHDVYAGKAKAKAFFDWLASPAIKPAVASMIATVEPVSTDTVIMHWVQFKGTPKEVDGRDVFVVRNGKIVFQSVQPKP
jgi:hypothetical protein